MTTRPKTKTTRPKKQAVTIPYGHPPLVEKTRQLAMEHILSNVTDSVKTLASANKLFDRFISHKGWIGPQDRVGLLDFSFDFKVDAPTKIRFLVYPIVGGNGDPLEVDHSRKLAQLTFQLDPKGWGELTLVHSSGVSSAWVEWLESAANLVRGLWDADLADGNLHGITNPATREGFASRWGAVVWAVEYLQPIAKGLKLAVIDDEDEAQEHCTNLVSEARQVLLITPWLSDQLMNHGVVAGIVGGLPLWSRDNLDAPHLDRALQAIAYEKYSESVNSELAQSIQPKE